MIMENERRMTSNWKYKYFLRITIWNVALPMLVQGTEVCCFQIPLAPLEVEHKKTMVSVHTGCSHYLSGGLSADNIATGKKKTEI